MNGRSAAGPVGLLWVFWALLSLLIFCALWAGGAREIMPMWMGSAGFSTWAAFGLDKGLARAGHRRVPERQLHGLVLLGGGIGGLAGMLTFRHKTRKPWFWVSGVTASVLWLAGWGALALWRSG